MEMAQIQASSLRIDTSFSAGQLSLHEYRKFLSRQDSTKMSPTSPRLRPRLKRKPAALDLCQRSHHDLAFQFQSPVSSAPSSPPPLSFSQSVISLPGGDLPTPISAMSMIRPFSQQGSSSYSLGTRRMDPFSARLRRPPHHFPSHSRTSSDSTLPSASAPTLTIKHNGAEFEILNPKSSSSFHFGETSTYRLSNFLKDTMEEESPDISPAHSFINYGLPDDVIRPLSASESAVLSKHTTPPLSSELPQSSYSFGALPPLKEQPSSPVSSRSPKTPVRTLRQKVSRLFSSSDKRSSSRLDIDLNEKHGHEELHSERDVPHSPLSDHWEAEASATTLHQPETAVDITSFEYGNHNSTHYDSEESHSRRRPTWGAHSSNRHQTLQDALRQLETDNNGLTFDDITRYVDSELHDHGSEHADGDRSLDKKVEQPWQPDTWNEPTLVRTPHNRPSDSNLSTNAPSTRASIRPYVERAAAFMAGGGRSSVSSLIDQDEEKHEALNIKTINGDGYGKAEDEEDDRTEVDDEPTPFLRRSISRRARPLSSNPPDLDTPLLFDSTSSLASISNVCVVTLPPRRTAMPQPLARTSWSPEIPARHPDHRIVRFDDDTTTTSINPKAGTPPPLTLTASQLGEEGVVTTSMKPRKKVKKHSSGCHCL